MNKGNTIFIGENKNFWERNRRSGGYLLKRRAGQIAVSVIRGLLMFGLCFMIIRPLITRFSLSLMSEADMYDSTIRLLPRHVTLDNYRIVAELTDMPRSMINTAWISLLMSLCQVVSTTLVAYGFARFDFPLKKFWFACVVFLIVVPPQTISTSLVLSFSHFDIFGVIRAITGRDMNLRSSILPYTLMGLTCMGLKNGLYIYMLRQYFKSVPESLEEAAYVDGCGTMHTFFRIMLPDALPTIASCFLFGFVWQWTDLFYTRNFLNGYSMYSKQLTSMSAAMGKYFSNKATETVVVPLGRQMQLIGIGVFICCVPLIILYCFTQKAFVQSLVMTGSKE